MTDDEVIFSSIDPISHTINDVRLSKACIMACPHLILTPEHYREDGTCRCDDPEHTEMIEWEYTWDGSKWV